MPATQPDAKLIRRLAQEQRYQVGPLEKAYRLGAILAEIARHRFLGEHLVLKGGTALHLYHGNLGRFSVDADLNYLDAKDTIDLPEAKRSVLAAVEMIAKIQGYTPRIVKDTYALHSKVLAYSTVNGGTDTIKLDLNFLERIPVLPPRPVSPPEMFRLDAPPIQCLDLTELAGSKVATASLRGAPRDVFDVATLDWTNVDGPLARKVAIFQGLLDHPGLVNFDPSRLEDLSKDGWDRDVRNMLRKGSTVDLNEIKRLAMKRIHGVLPLKPDEKVCQSRLLEGAWEPRLLFGAAPVSDGLEEHPGMLWRLRYPDARLPR